MLIELGLLWIVHECIDILTILPGALRDMPSWTSVVCVLLIEIEICPLFGCL